MEEWDEFSDKVKRIRKDPEQASSLLKMVDLREKNLISLAMPEFSTLRTEAHYEIVKELITAILAIDGWKTTSHEMLIGYVAKNCKEIDASEAALLDQLRHIRNDIAYRGVMITPSYLEVNETHIRKVIEKLKKLVSIKLCN
ncbi:hypothetical protein HY486_01085 [Candidatus Woesearchaeota archaeon]|nr:hypothetical protein [Candidatus Woesearchaeota archaeon]